VIGGLALVAILLIGAFCLCRRRRTRQPLSSNVPPSEYTAVDTKSPVLERQQYPGELAAGYEVVEAPTTEIRHELDAGEHNRL
jgi:hypothetical protein